MIAALRSIPTYFTRIGAALPTISLSKHGQFTIKQAGGTADELHIPLRNSSGALEYERIVTKDYADTLYADIASETFNSVDTFPRGAAQSNSEFDTVFVSNSTNAMYMGRADAAYTTITIYTEVETAAATITWAEVGIGTSSAPSFGGNIDITRRGYTDVSASFDSTGEKTVSITVSGISIGDHLWVLMGSQATTPYQTIRVNHSDAIGTWQSASSTRISTMASPTSFTAQSAADQAAFGCWIGA